MAKVIIDRDQIERLDWRELNSPAEKGRRRLLITTDNFLPRWDGISRFLSEIIPRLQQSYDITVVAPDYGLIAIDKVTIEKIPLTKQKYGDYTPAKFAYRRISRLVRSHALVFNQAVGPIGICAIIAARRSHRPIASYIHSIEWELVPKALLPTGPFRGLLLPFSKRSVRLLYNKCTVLIVPSENIAELFSWERVSTPKRVAHLGVDTTKFSPGDRLLAREKLNIPPDTFVVGYHGRVGHEKNLLILLRAFRRLQLPKKRLIIVGDGVPSIVERFKKYSDVVVTGSTNHVIPYLQAMNVYVQPSFTETTSLAVIEAMACELPVISSKVGYIQHYIIDGKNGVFFDNTNVHDLTTKITYLHNHPELCLQLGKAARKTVIAEFDWERTAKDIKGILDSI